MSTSNYVVFQPPCGISGQHIAYYTTHYQTFLVDYLVWDAESGQCVHSLSRKTPLRLPHEDEGDGCWRRFEEECVTPLARNIAPGSIATVNESFPPLGDFNFSL